MELKYVYNYARQDKKLCFNRTFMELKFIQGVATHHVWSVLIVPLWN